MRVLITGGEGQLARELQFQLAPSTEVVSFPKKQMDITDTKLLPKVIQQIQPDVVIHPAAITNVDYCEQFPEKAFQVNTDAAVALAEETKKAGAKFIFISTDYVFSGKENRPYHEADEPNPINIYGMTKYNAEKRLASFNNVIIIRTSWLFGNTGNNFAKKIILKAKEERELYVVKDQIGSPTYIPDLAKGIIAMFQEDNGIYHLANKGACSWYIFAKTIVEEMGLKVNVNPITSKEFSLKALRPSYSVLDNVKAKRKGIILPAWEQAVKQFVKKELEK